MLIAFKLKLALACVAGLAGPLAVAPLFSEGGSPDGILRDRQAMVELQPGSMSYRAAGDFTHAGRQAEAPLVSVRLDRPLSIMRHQVGAADYQRCVDDGACRALDRNVAIAIDRPAVQVSWQDAEVYAAGCRARPAIVTVCRATRNGPLPPAANSAMTPCRSTTTIRRNAGSAATSANPTATPTTTKPMPSAASAPTRTACSISRAMSGNGPRPVSCAPRWTMRAARFRRMPIAASASPRAGTAPMSPISSATPAPAAARPACRRTISAFGWYASSHHG